MMKFELPIVVVNAGELYATSVDTGRLQFYGDEPVEKGGADVGPTAHQLLKKQLFIRTYLWKETWMMFRKAGFSSSLTNVLSIKH